MAQPLGKKQTKMPVYDKETSKRRRRNGTTGNHANILVTHDTMKLA